MKILNFVRLVIGSPFLIVSMASSFVANLIIGPQFVQSLIEEHLSSHHKGHGCAQDPDMHHED